MSPASHLEAAHTQWGAMCGHAALAAALWQPIESVRSLFDREGGYVNIPQMKLAIQRAGREWYLLRGAIDPGADAGVALLDWIGPWSGNTRAQCRHRHWIAVMRLGDGIVIADTNIQPGVAFTFADWRETVEFYLPERATGYRVWGTLALKERKDDDA